MRGSLRTVLIALAALMLLCGASTARAALQETPLFAEAAAKNMASLQPIPRAGRTDDIAKAAVFLASDDSTFINGHDLVVDGGVVGGRLWTPHQQGVQAMRQAFGVAEG